ncbi:MAG: hypothetical protein ACREFD_09885 [Stellaceae bacterium]
MKSLADCGKIIATIGRQQATANQRVDLAVPDLNRDASEMFPPAIAMPSHSDGAG